MKIYSFLTNKYTLSFFILLFCVALDIVLHKGMSRVILPESFTEKRGPMHFATCEQSLLVANKKWIKGVNTVARLAQQEVFLAGFEVDVYFDTAKNHFLVYHDSAVISGLDLETILQKYQSRNMTASVWLDFKNLSVYNLSQSLKHVSVLRQRYALQNKMIIESSAAQLLQPFCDSGFYSSYYIPFFNPYQVDEKTLVSMIDSISLQLKQYRVSALSGYYFQYPVLKKYFPRFPVLTWTGNSSLSLVANSFNRSLLNDQNVKVVLFPD